MSLTDEPLIHPTQGPRRRLLAASLGGLALAAWPGRSQAGAQVEEPLADKTRGALSAAIAYAAPPKPVFPDTAQRMRFLRWLTEMSKRLAKRVPDLQSRVELLETLWYESKRAGLDVSLVLGLVQVESGFRKYAISTAGARGLMQVMPFWTRSIGDGDAGKLFHMQTNLRFGCVILRHYIDIEKGDMYLALGRYNGSRGKPQYPNAVFACQRQWQWTDPEDLMPPAKPAASR